jgi:hypothetical protein
MSDSTSGTTVTLCPSAQAEWENSVAIGVVGGTADQPLMVPLATPQPVTDQLVALAAPVTPTEVFRFAAPCMGSGCVHFAEGQCHLATRMVILLPAVSERLPRCGIRLHCRWWQQEGRAACMRCPQMVTANYHPSETMRQAADPATPPA